jgi:F-type H+-transporting ATPase subunit delta
MKFTAKQYAQALLESLEATAPADTDKVLDNFVATIAENNDFKLYEEIISEFHKLDLAKKGVKQADVSSAHPLNSENEKQIVEALNDYVKGKVELKKQIDESLIGGVVVRMDDVLIDASVKNSLEQLKKDLSQ